MSPSRRESLVALERMAARYPMRAPFDPSNRYPEYPFDELAASPEDGEVYNAVRLALRDLGLDAERFGTADWNPLGELVSPGGTVLLKPNLVIHEHAAGAEGLLATLAHPLVLRALTDYALLAVGATGRIWIGGSPIKEVDFERVTQINGLADTVAAVANRYSELYERLVTTSQTGFSDSHRR